MAFRMLRAAVFLKNGCSCLSGKKKGRDNKDNFPVAYKPCKNLSDLHFLHVTFLLCVTEDHFIRCYGPSLLAEIPLNCCRGKHQNWSLEHVHCFSGELKQNMEIHFLKVSVGFCQNYYLQKMSLNLLRGCTLHWMVQIWGEKRETWVHHQWGRQSWFLHVERFVCAYENWHHGVGMLTVFCILLAALTGNHVFQREFSIFISLCFHISPVLFWM